VRSIIATCSNYILHILRDPGATSQDDAIFSSERYLRCESLLQELKNSYRTSSGTGRIPSRRLAKKISARRSNWATLSPSYTKWFSTSNAGNWVLKENFRKKDSTKLRKSQTVTCVQGNNICRSISWRTYFLHCCWWHVKLAEYTTYHFSPWCELSFLVDS